MRSKEIGQIMANRIGSLDDMHRKGLLTIQEREARTSEVFALAIRLNAEMDTAQALNAAGYIGGKDLDSTARSQVSDRMDA